jgi:hypothetical protein
MMGSRGISPQGMRRGEQVSGGKHRAQATSRAPARDAHSRR